MAVYDLNPGQTPGTTVALNPFTRGNLGPVVGSPFNVTPTPTIILPANTSAPERATVAIFNAGPATVFLLEGTSPAITPTNYNHPLPPNRLWEPDPNFRFRGAMQAITASGNATVRVSESVVLL